MREAEAPQQVSFKMFSPQRLSARCWAGQMADSRCNRSSRPRARRVQPVAAAANKQAGGGSRRSGASSGTEPVREAVTFVHSIGGTPINVERLTQGEPDSLLERCGSRGFFTADGTRSRALARLPEDGPVRLSYLVGGRLLACGRGMARLPSALLPRIARRSLMGGFGAINKAARALPSIVCGCAACRGTRPLSTQAPPSRSWSRCEPLCTAWRVQRMMGL